jgi:[acyl-carrier-protein] S-malonyltransferase
VSVGIIFPGMGPSGYADLAKFIVTDDRARRLRRTADNVLGYPLLDRYRAAEADYSEYSQIAFLISCIALLERATEMIDSEIVACAGASFGAKTASVLAGSLPFEEAVLLTARLARCEDEYFRAHHQDVLTQSVARLPRQALLEILDAMTARGEWHDISCHIDEDFFMVSMRESSLDSFLRQARAAGGLPLYAMRPPMHSAAFWELRCKAEDEVLGDFTFRDPKLPVIADFDGSVVDTAVGLRAMLLDGIVRQVHWPEVVGALKGLGVTTVYIPGPDSLFGRVRSTTENFDVVAITPRTRGNSRLCGMSNSRYFFAGIYRSCPRTTKSIRALSSANSGWTRSASSISLLRWSPRMASASPRTLFPWKRSRILASFGPPCAERGTRHCDTGSGALR